MCLISDNFHKGVPLCVVYVSIKFILIELNLQKLLRIRFPRDVILTIFRLENQ